MNAQNLPDGIDSRDHYSYIESWDEYWMEVAWAISRKSKDPRCKVGAIVVSEDNVILSTGFNGLPRNVWDNPAILDDAKEKLKQVCHAEMNSVYNAARQGVPLRGATLYATKFPCLTCLNAIVQAGIAKVFTQDNKYWDDDPADGDHSRKRTMIQQIPVEIVAPNHPDFATHQAGPAKRRPAAAVQPPTRENSAEEPSSMASVHELDVEKEPRKVAKKSAPKPRKPKRPKRADDRTEPLWKAKAGDAS